MTLKATEIVEILKQLNQSQCHDFQLTLGGDSLRVCRGVAGQAASQVVTAPAAPAPQVAVQPAARPAASASAPAASAPASTARAAVQPADEGAITAPMGGVFYRRPSPEEPPFVEEGTVVKAGDPVCVIEVMKLFSTVYAETGGRVVAIHASEGASIEKDQALFTLEPIGARA